MHQNDLLLSNRQKQQFTPAHPSSLQGQALQGAPIHLYAQACAKSSEGVWVLKKDIERGGQVEEFFRERLWGQIAKRDCKAELETTIHGKALLDVGSPIIIENCPLCYILELACPGRKDPWRVCLSATKDMTQSLCLMIWYVSIEICKQSIEICKQSIEICK